MSTRRAAVFRESIDEQAVDNPDFAHALFVGLTRLKKGEFSREIVDVVLQKEDGEYNIYDAYGVGSMYASLQRGEAAVTFLDVPDVPRRDRNRDENDRILKHVRRSFTADFYGGPGDEDGFVDWQDGEIFFTVADEKQEALRLKAGTVPLEVGTTEVSRTLLHLVQELGLARWPYGHKVVHVIKMIRPVDILWRCDLATVRAKAAELRADALS
jgi:hypothetical protein